MIGKTIMWVLFALFSIVCIGWLSMLVLNATRTESLRRGARELRSERAEKGIGPIRIGAAGGWDSGFQPVLDGINLAADEINRAGGVRGRQIQIVPKDDRASAVTGLKVAQELADDIGVVAVIGHPNSSVSIAVSTIYEYYGLLMLSPLSTNPALTRRGLKMIFRNIPTDAAFGEQLADFAHKKGYRRIAIYYLQEDYARGLANIFEKRCGELGMTVVDRMYYDSTSKSADFADDMSTWKKQFQFDAILLAGFLPQAGEVLKIIRATGITVPVLSGESLASEELIKTAGKAAENSVISSTFDQLEKRDEVVQFNASYRAKYGVMPDGYAAQGYDALRLIAHVIESSGSTVPEKMSEALHTVKDWPGVTGRHTFDKNGDVIGKRSMMRTVIDGKFKLVE